MKPYRTKTKNSDIYRQRRRTTLRDDKPFSKSLSGRLTPLEAYEYKTGLNWFESKDLRAKLPVVYQDLLYLLYEKGKTQAEAAAILGWTQGNVCCQLKRIYKRLRWLSRCEKIAPKEIRNVDSRGRPGNGPRILELVKQGEMCQSHIAEKLGLCQATIHLWFERWHLRPPQESRPWSLDRLNKRKGGLPPWIVQTKSATREN